jgi:hypothetical protein
MSPGRISTRSSRNDRACTVRRARECAEARRGPRLRIDRHQPRGLLPVAGDGDLFALLHQVHQLAELVLCLEGADLAHELFHRPSASRGRHAGIGLDVGNAGRDVAGGQIAPGDSDRHGGSAREVDAPSAMRERHFLDHPVPTRPAASPAAEEGFGHRTRGATAHARARVEPERGASRPAAPA